MSWNGATEVKSWEIYAGSSKSTLKVVSTVAKRGFETKAQIATAKYVQIKPVMKGGCSCKNTPSSAVVTVS